MKRIRWHADVGPIWYDLFKIVPESPYFDDLSGVYVIWIGTDNRTILCVGAGNIRHSLTARRESPELSEFLVQPVFVTWALVPNDEQPGVRHYLSDLLHPTIGDNWRTLDAPIPVNQPPWKVQPQ